MPLKWPDRNVRNVNKREDRTLKGLHQRPTRRILHDRISTKRASSIAESLERNQCNQIFIETSGANSSREIWQYRRGRTSAYFERPCRRIDQCFYGISGIDHRCAISTGQDSDTVVKLEKIPPDQAPPKSDPTTQLPLSSSNISAQSRVHLLIGHALRSTYNCASRRVRSALSEWKSALSSTQ